MFNGIVTHVGIIKKIHKNNKNCMFEISSSMKFKKKEIGSSISCSGACLTLESFNNNVSKFYLSIETLKRTAFKFSKINDQINLEKSLKFGDRMSGHFVQGHVDITCVIKKINVVGKSWIITFNILKKYKKYLVEKGSITINGVSLTVAKLSKNSFEISIIPHTLRQTNLFKLKKNNIVNVEFDVLGKYVESFFK